MDHARTSAAGAPHEPTDASEEADEWEPGAPSVRAMAPSIVFGALVPLGVYYVVRKHVGGDADALAIAGIPAALFTVVQWFRQRRIDPIAAAVLFGFVVGVGVSYAMGGNAFVLRARDSVLTGIFALTCLGSLLVGRPVMFYVGRALSAGGDAARLRAYNELWEVAEARRVFAVITAVWGVGLLVDSATRVTLAAELKSGQFLAVSPPVAAIYIATMFVWTVRYVKRARQTTEEAVAAAEAEAPPGG